MNKPDGAKMDTTTEDSYITQENNSWTSVQIWLVVTGVTGGLCVLMGVIYALLYFLKIKPYEKRKARMGGDFYYSENLVPLDEGRKHQYTYNWIWYHGRPPGDDTDAPRKKRRIPRIKRKKQKQRRTMVEASLADEESEE